MNKDLTVGEPRTVLWKFCLPLFGSVIFQQLYNIADSFVAGRFISDKALAAVGNSYEITLIFLAFAFGCNIGCSVVCSQAYGGKRISELKTTVQTTFIAGGVLCLLLTLMGLLFCDPLLKLIHTPQNIFADSGLYLRIYSLGLPFLFFYNIANGIFSALGDSKTPFIFLVCSSTANIFTDILFVAGFSMGVAGVAWATFLCQGISCVLSAAVLYKRLKKMKTEEKPPLFSKTILYKIAKIAIPSILQQSFISVGNIVIQGVINGFDYAVIAGYSGGVKLNNMVITSFTTLGNGISNFTAQNMGADKPQRIKKGFLSGVLMVWLICLPVFALYFFGASLCLKLFLENPNGLAAETGTIFLRILSPFYFVVSVKLIADGVLRGKGLMKQFCAATFTDLILRVILSVILSKTALGSTGIWLSWPIGWSIATALSVYFAVSSIKRIRSK